MLEFLPPNREEFVEVDKRRVIGDMAIATALLEKGLLTTEDLERAVMKATHFVDQAMAKQRDEELAEFDKKHPGVREIWGKITGSEMA